MNFKKRAVPNWRARQPKKQLDVESKGAVIGGLRVTWNSNICERVMMMDKSQSSLATLFSQTYTTKSSHELLKNTISV